jgi:hypothetical protein
MKVPSGGSKASTRFLNHQARPERWFRSALLFSSSGPAARLWVSRAPFIVLPSGCPKIRAVMTGSNEVWSQQAMATTGHQPRSYGKKNGAIRARRWQTARATERGRWWFQSTEIPAAYKKGRLVNAQPVSVYDRLRPRSRPTGPLQALA